jgi:hypothetical protein
MAITVSGTSITFNDGTTQSTAAGAIPANFAVGAYTFAFVGLNSPTSLASRAQNYATGTTIAGSSLRVDNRATGTNVVGQPAPLAAVTIGANLNSTVFPTANTTTLAGTWRLMSGSQTWCYNFDNGCGNFSAVWYGLFWIRIS